MVQRDGMDPEGRVDLATAQRIVKAAVVEATNDGGDKTQAIVTAKVAQATRRGARLNALLAAGVALTFVAVVVAAWAVYRSRRAADVLAAEAGLKGAPSIAAPVGTVPSEVLSGRDIYEKNRSSLYVMAQVQGRMISGCCTAFAIDVNLLATNAHCVLTCGTRGGQAVVVQNESGGKVKFSIVAMKAHPGYHADAKSADSADLGLLRVASKLPTHVTLASDAELRALGPGDDVYVLGFPGRVMDPVSPSATFLKGHVGRLMGFDERPTTPDQAKLILHDAVTRGGNSGSPIFNQYGHVVGVHAAHVDDEEEVTIAGQKASVVQSSPFRIGMRSDLLREVPRP